MYKTIKTLALVTVIMVTANTSVFAKTNGTSFDWNPVMDAIIQVESEGNPKAVSGNCCGAMQITPILVRECNSILKERGSKQRYTLADRFDVKKSREMFVLIQSHYNPQNDIERAIRSWSGGPRYSTRSTQSYYRKVMARLNAK